MGTHAFAAQYQQNPMPIGGSLIKREWLHYYEAAWAPVEWDQVIQSWDTASSISATADYSVGMTFGIKERTAHLLDVLRGRWDYPRLRARVISYADQWSADKVLLENSSSGLNLGPDLRVTRDLWPTLMRPKGDKASRVESHSAKIEAGHIRFPRQAGWLDAFLDEVLRFPSGRHDDQVDALTQFLEYYARLQRGWRSHDRVTPQPSRSRFPDGTWFDRVGISRHGMPIA